MRGRSDSECLLKQFPRSRQQYRVEQEQQRAQSEAAVRNQLAATGRKVLGDILERLFARVLREAPNAHRERGKLAITLGLGSLEASLAGVGGHRNQGAMPADLFRQSKWDVVAAEEIVVHQQHPKYPWISSLWYCRLPDTTLAGTRLRITVSGANNGQSRLFSLAALSMLIWSQLQ